jgi:hypothetical protein
VIGSSQGFPVQITIHIFDQNLFLKAGYIEHWAQACKITPISYHLGRLINTTASVSKPVLHFETCKACQNSYSGQLVFDYRYHSFGQDEASLASLSFEPM